MDKKKKANGQKEDSQQPAIVKGSGQDLLTAILLGKAQPSNPVVAVIVERARRSSTEIEAIMRRRSDLETQLHAVDLRLQQLQGILQEDSALVQQFDGSLDRYMVEPTETPPLEPATADGIPTPSGNSEDGGKGTSANEQSQDAK